MNMQAISPEYTTHWTNFLGYSEHLQTSLATSKASPVATKKRTDQFKILCNFINQIHQQILRGACEII